MKRLIITALLSACAMAVHASPDADTVSYLPHSSPHPYSHRKAPSYLSLMSSGGSVLKTNDFVKGDKAIPSYNSYSLKYAVCSKGDSWQDVAYGMPYYGLGLYTVNFFRSNDLGTPVSLYMFSGATIAHFGRHFALNYEWNLGVSMNWKPYDAFDNPGNVAIGSRVNVHIGLNLYLKWYLSRRLDLHFGAGLTHFSNGASKMPNSGINMIDGSIALAYYFNREQRHDKYYTMAVTPPPARKHLEYDILVNISSRQIRADTVNTGLPSRYVNEKFTVLGLSGAVLYAPSYKYRYGISTDILYDESSHAKIWREENPVDGKMYERVKLGPTGKRFSIGLSAKGEVVMPHYSVFANLGWQMLHGNKRDARLYQVIGLKVYLKDNVFGTFGIRATKFSKAQYLY